MQMSMMRSLFLICFITNILSTKALADYVCDDAVDKLNEQKLQTAEQKNAKGDVKSAYTIVRSIPDEFCTQLATKRRSALYHATTKSLGAKEELNKNYRAAYNYYKEGKWTAEAKRTLMLHTQTHAASYQEMAFTRDELFYLDDKQLTAEFATIINSRLNQLTQEEEKTFNTSSDTLALLENINQWHSLISATEYAPTKLTATKRGDVLSKNPAPAIKERAMSYYQFGGNQQRINALKSDALKLAQIEEKKGNRSTAARLYAIADQHEKADTLSSPLPSDDSARKKAFEKEQEALEKELGF